MGRGIPPPVERRWTIGQRRGQDRRVKRRAVARSPAPWHWERDGVTQSPTECRVWETTGPPSDATSDRLIASAERQVTIIPLTIGLLSGLFSILGSRELFSGIETLESR